MLRTLPLLLLSATALCFVGCASAPPPPLTQLYVTPAPQELEGLRVHVRNSTMLTAERNGEDVNWLTVWTRASVQRLLTRAGYTVIVDPRDPTDLVIDVDIDWQMDERGVATLTASSEQSVVAQLSAIVRDPAGAESDVRGTDTLVSELSRSKAVVWLADERLAASERIGSTRQPHGQ